MTINQPPSLFCFGLGYSASAIARDRLAAGWRVSGTVRSAEKVEALRAEGIEAFLYEAEAAPAGALLTALTGSSHLLQSVPCDGTGDPVLRWAGTIIAALPLTWMGYLSTTVVYGDWQGAWVDEASPTRSKSSRGLLRLAAERGWAETGLPVHLFRLAGIYGPGRNALVSVQAGRSECIDKPGQVFSRIHRTDICRTVVASMMAPVARPGRPEIYNVCDDLPCPPQEVIAHAARLLGLPPPPLVPFAEAAPRMSPMARSFYADNKRVRNDKIKAALSVRLAYPTYRDGLAAELARLTAGETTL